MPASYLSPVLGTETEVLFKEIDARQHIDELAVRVGRLSAENERLLAEQAATTMSDAEMADLRDVLGAQVFGNICGHGAGKRRCDVFVCELERSVAVEVGVA